MRSQTLYQVVMGECPFRAGGGPRPETPANRILGVTAQQGPNALCLCPACRRFIFSSGTFAGGLIQRLVTELQLKSQLLVYFALGIEPRLKSTVEERGTKYRAHVEIIEREIFLYAVRRRIASPTSSACFPRSPPREVVRLNMPPAGCPPRAGSIYSDAVLLPFYK